MPLRGWIQMRMLFIRPGDRQLKRTDLIRATLYYLYPWARGLPSFNDTLFFFLSSALFCGCYMMCWEQELIFFVLSPYSEHVWSEISSPWLICHDLTTVAPLLVVVRPARDRTCCPINLSTVQSFIARLFLIVMGISAEIRALQHLLLAPSTAAIKQIVHIEFRVSLHSVVQYDWNNLYSAVQRMQCIGSQALWGFYHIFKPLLAYRHRMWGGKSGYEILWNVIFFKCSNMYLLWPGGYMHWLWCPGTLENWVTPSSVLWFLHLCINISLFVLYKRFT